MVYNTESIFSLTISGNIQYHLMEKQEIRSSRVNVGLILPMQLHDLFEQSVQIKRKDSWTKKITKVLP